VRLVEPARLAGADCTLPHSNFFAPSARKPEKRAGGDIPPPRTTTAARDPGIPGLGQIATELSEPFPLDPRPGGPPSPLDPQLL